MTYRKNDYFVGKEKESGKWFFGGGGFKKKEPKPDPLEEYIKSLRKGSLGLPKTPWQSKMDLGKKASSANSLFVEAQSQDGDSDSSKCTYLCFCWGKSLRKLKEMRIAMQFANGNFNKTASYVMVWLNMNLQVAQFFFWSK